MIQQLKDTLRRSPRLYSGAQRVYYAGLYAAERLLGSRMHVWIWRYLRPVSAADVEQTISHPHREMLVEAIGEFAPINAALEVGCNAGANLVLLARRYPAATLDGVDISAQAIEQGRRWLDAHSMSRVRLSLGSATDLSHFGDGQYDVVFTDAILMYVGPDRITEALAEMGRIARKAVVLNEWSLEEQDERRHYWYDLHWVHNYPRLLKEIFPGSQIVVERIPEKVWGGAGWSEYGTLLRMTRAGGNGHDAA